MPNSCIEIHTSPQKRMVIHASALLDDVYTCPDTPKFLRQALPDSWQVRNEVTTAKVIQAPSLAPSWIAALLAWGAQVAWESGSITSLGETPRLKAKSLLLSLNTPGRYSYLASVGKTLTSDPLVIIATVVDIEDNLVKDARLVLTGVGNKEPHILKACSLLVGKPFDKEHILATSHAVQKETFWKEDYRASLEYRQEMAAVLTRRALEMCLKGAE